MIIDDKIFDTYSCVSYTEVFDTIKQLKDNNWKYHGCYQYHGIRVYENDPLMKLYNHLYEKLSIRLVFNGSVKFLNYHFLTKQ